MACIKIRNFGPIKNGYNGNDGFLEIAPVTLFIGNQGSGKSTAAKLIATFMWMEKVLVRGDYAKKDFTVKDFLEERLPYHHIAEYLKKSTEIVYNGDAYRISYTNGNLNIAEKTSTDYTLPQIIYIPAERSIISAVGNTAKLKGIAGGLLDLIIEYGNAKDAITKPVPLPIAGISAEYDRERSIIFICGDDYRIRLAESASGFQSLVPAYIVSRYLSDSILNTKNGKTMSSDERERFIKETEAIRANNEFSEEQKRISIASLAKKFNKASFVNIIEEPEISLFPEAQRKFLYELLAFNHAVPNGETVLKNKLIITTHSPYFINFLSIAIQGYTLYEKIKKAINKENLIKALSSIVPLNALTSGKNTAIYQLDEKTGIILKLPYVYEIPSDKNYLNNQIQQGNIEFDRLLEIEETIEC